MRRVGIVLLVVLALGGCRFAPDGRGLDDGAVVAGAAIDAQADAPVDAAIDARVCPIAPRGCTGFTCAGSASCYYVCEKEGWQPARGRCGSDGLGCLATINDAAENLCIHAATAPQFPDLVWFGWRQAANATEPGGGWGWECGTSTFVAGNWGQFEPNDLGGHEDCGAMGAGAAWIDGTCSTPLRYVCELP